jgi:hypothetical protein
MQVLGQSGKIVLQYNDTDYANLETINFASITEVDSSGDTVGNTGSTKHSVGEAGAGRTLASATERHTAR